MKKRMIIFLLGITVGLGLSAQVSLDSVKHELYRVNQVFDSSRVLGFDVTIKYSSDTIYGKFAHEEMDGKYILNDQNIYYQMGSTEYMQNDSFVYNIYNDEKMLMMTRDVVAAKSNLFPVREFVDSILTWYDTAYTITLTEFDDQRVIGFSAKFDSLPYKYFAVYYDTGSYYPDRIDMRFYDEAEESDTVYLINDSTSKIPFQKKPVQRRITMEFTKYFNVTSLDVFDNTNYVIYNRQTRRYRPVERFKGYRFIANGVQADPPGESNEIYPPPQDE